MSSNKISIIIPVLNEAAIILDSLQKLAKNKGNVEIVVVDGGSRDKTVELVRSIDVKLIVSPTPGRAKQMNLGAATATGDILLFLHADTYLPKDYQIIVTQILSQSKTVAGAFELAIDSQDRRLRLLEQMVNWRSRFFALPYGDQAIFLHTKVFQEIGGFPDLPIMEDFELMRRLKSRGNIAIASQAVLTSPRRWEKLGIFRTTLINQLTIIGYFLGIAPDRLASWYRCHKVERKQDK
ncbi:MAG: TIGR04283 family arsenosugar biosynthesis glycosyltransferase [Prochloraceae cyanobacterium]